MTYRPPDSIGRLILGGAAIAVLALPGCGSQAPPGVPLPLQAATDACTETHPAVGTNTLAVYRALPSATIRPDSTTIHQAITLMCERVAMLGVTNAHIYRVGADEIYVSLPAGGNTKRAQDQVGKTAQLYFYDWEPNVIGPGGKPAPTDASVTGGPEPGGAPTGLPEYKAVLRAAERPPETRKNDTTWDWRANCTLQENKATTGPNAGCIYGDWYLLDTTHEKVLRGPEETEANLYSEGVKTPKGAKLKAVHVNPGTIVVQAQAVEDHNNRKIIQPSPESWYVLKDNPALSGADIKNPRQSFDEGGGGTGQPNVTFEFTSSGGKIFQKVTKEIAERGQQAQLPGVRKPQAVQHFAVVLDGQIITAPFIDYTQNPEGIDPTTGSQISGGFTLTSAQNLADELQSGALPLRLELILFLQCPRFRGRMNARVRQIQQEQCNRG